MLCIPEVYKVYIKGTRETETSTKRALSRSTFTPFPYS